MTGLSLGSQLLMVLNYSNREVVAYNLQMPEPHTDDLDYILGMKPWKQLHWERPDSEVMAQWRLEPHPGFLEHFILQQIGEDITESGPRLAEILGNPTDWNPFDAVFALDSKPDIEGALTPREIWKQLEQWEEKQ